MYGMDDQRENLNKNVAFEPPPLPPLDPLVGAAFVQLSWLFHYHQSCIHVRSDDEPEPTSGPVVKSKDAAIENLESLLPYAAHTPVDLLLEPCTDIKSDNLDQQHENEDVAIETFGPLPDAVKIQRENEGAAIKAPDCSPPDTADIEFVVVIDIESDDMVHPNENKDAAIGLDVEPSTNIRSNTTDYQHETKNTAIGTFEPPPPDAANALVKTIVDCVAPLEPCVRIRSDNSSVANILKELCEEFSLFLDTLSQSATLAHRDFTTMKGIACIFSEMSTSTVSESSREIGAFNQKLFQSVRESEDSKVLLEKLLTLRREVTQSKYDLIRAINGLQKSLTLASRPLQEIAEYFGIPLSLCMSSFGEVVFTWVAMKMRRKLRRDKEALLASNALYEFFFKFEACITALINFWAVQAGAIGRIQRMENLEGSHLVSSLPLESIASRWAKSADASLDLGVKIQYLTSVTVPDLNGLPLPNSKSTRRRVRFRLRFRLTRKQFDALSKFVNRILHGNGRPHAA